MTSPEQAAAAFVKRYSFDDWFEPTLTAFRDALAALVAAERAAAAEACAALAHDWFARLADHEGTFGTDLTSANTLRNLAAALRALPLE